MCRYFLVCFISCANIFCIYRQCTKCTYIVFILQCQKAQATAKLSDRADTIVVLIIFNGVFDHVRTCTVTVPFCSLYIDQVSEKKYFKK
jgi:hypothetical protein